MIRLLLTSGRGPAECRIALSKALSVMEEEAEAAGVGIDVARAAAPDAYGPGSAIVALSGEGAAAFAQGWIGAVLWIAGSPVRPHHKRKNWFIGVFELPARAAARPLAVAEVRFEAFCAGGPGGQHQNKTASAVRAVHPPTGLAVVARSQRSQHRNKAEALERLAELLRLTGEIEAIAAEKDAWARHEQLERGRANRRFKGLEFRPA
jgi:peptide chain release factor